MHREVLVSSVGRAHPFHPHRYVSLPDILVLRQIQDPVRNQTNDVCQLVRHVTHVRTLCINVLIFNTIR